MFEEYIYLSQPLCIIFVTGQDTRPSLYRDSTTVQFVSLKSYDARPGTTVRIVKTVATQLSSVGNKIYLRFLEFLTKIAYKYLTNA